MSGHKASSRFLVYLVRSLYIFQKKIEPLDCKEATFKFPTFDGRDNCTFGKMWQLLHDKNGYLYSSLKENGITYKFDSDSDRMILLDSIIQWKNAFTTALDKNVSTAYLPIEDDYGGVARMMLILYGFDVEDDYTQLVVSWKTV